MADQSNGIRMLRIDQVAEKVGYKESTLYDWMNPRSSRHKPHFPLPRKNGRSNRWFESEIDDFCILEFGESNNHPASRRQPLSEGNAATRVPLAHVGEIRDDSDAPPRMPSSSKGEATAPIPYLAEPQRITVTDLPEATQISMPTDLEDGASAKCVGEAEVPPETIAPSRDKRRTATMTQTDASGKTRTITVELPGKRRVFLKSD
jgi:prophage regulatory protein